jgi:hypothetical protein
MSSFWPWVAVALLGAYHGLNPAMGWLFALALGLQEKRRSAVITALLPITIGHAAAIGLALLILSIAQRLIPTHTLKWPVAAILLALGVYRMFRASHPRNAGMRVGGRDLFLWSFLMASAHGAGLMLMPVLLSGRMPPMHHAAHAPTQGGASQLGTTVILLSIVVHTLAMLIVAGIMALLFFALYDHYGLKILRRAWLNFDLMWAVALLIAAAAVLLY